MFTKIPYQFIKYVNIFITRYLKFHHSTGHKHGYQIRTPFWEQTSSDLNTYHNRLSHMHDNDVVVVRSSYFPSWHANSKRRVSYKPHKHPTLSILVSVFFHLSCSRQLEQSPHLLIKVAEFCSGMPIRLLYPYC